MLDCPALGQLKARRIDRNVRIPVAELRRFATPGISDLTIE